MEKVDAPASVSELELLHKMAPDEMKFLIDLIRQADVNNIAELQYRSVRVRFFQKPGAAKTAAFNMMPGAR